MRIKNNNDPYKQIKNIYENINQNFLKNISKETSDINVINKNDNSIYDDEEEKLPHLNEILMDPFHIHYTQYYL